MTDRTNETTSKEPSMSMTIDDLIRILTESAGMDESLEGSSDLSDRPFDDLGYDSLALMETAAHIEQEYGIVIPDEQITELKTPRALLDLVNNSQSAGSPNPAQR
jgi:act minimal PKS acyl carrier protein